METPGTSCVTGRKIRINNAICEKADDARRDWGVLLNAVNKPPTKIVPSSFTLSTADLAAVGGLRWTEGGIYRAIRIQPQNIADLMLKGFANSVDDLASSDDKLPIRSRRDGKHPCVVPAERKAVIE